MQIAELFWRQRFHGRLRTNRHENRRLDHTMSGVQPATASPRAFILRNEFKTHIERLVSSLEGALNQVTCSISTIFDLT